MARAKTGGGPGTNQYGIRGQAKSVSLVPPAPQVVPLLESYRCGQLWLTNCDEMIHPPHYSHGSHPTNTDMHTLPADEAMLRAMTSSRSEIVRSAVAAHISAPKECLVRLASDASWRVLQSLATNPDCPAEVLEHLAHKGNPQLTEMVAAHINMSPDTLARLAEAPHTTASLRAEVAYNPHCPPETLRRLGGFPDLKIRAAVPCNPNCPGPTLERLVGDTHMAVRAQAVSNPSCKPEWLARVVGHNYEVDVWMVQNPICPPELLSKIWYDYQDRIFAHQYVAAHANIPPDLMLEAVRAKEVAVRTHLAGNIKCSPEILQQLSQDPSVEVRQAVAGNPSCPEHIRVAAALTL